MSQHCKKKNDVEVIKKDVLIKRNLAVKEDFFLNGDFFLRGEIHQEFLDPATGTCFIRNLGQIVSLVDQCSIVTVEFNSSIQAVCESLGQNGAAFIILVTEETMPRTYTINNPSSCSGRLIDSVSGQDVIVNANETTTFVVNQERHIIFPGDPAQALTTLVIVNAVRNIQHYAVPAAKEFVPVWVQESSSPLGTTVNFVNMTQYFNRHVLVTNTSTSATTLIVPDNLGNIVKVIQPGQAADVYIFQDNVTVHAHVILHL